MSTPVPRSKANPLGLPLESENVKPITRPDTTTRAGTPESYYSGDGPEGGSVDPQRINHPRDRVAKPNSIYPTGQGV